MFHINGRLGLFLLLSLFLQQVVFAQQNSDENGTENEQKTLTEQGLEHWYKGDFVTAIDVLIKADEAGEINGSIALSKLYHFSSEFELALPLLQKAEAAEDQESMLVLVEYYEKGLGMEKPDAEKARSILDKLLLLNYTPALMFKAEALGNGRLSFEKDITVSYQQLQKLAEDKYLPAMKKMYNTYLHGVPGIAADRVQANFWRQQLQEIEKKNQEVISDKY